MDDKWLSNLQEAASRYDNLTISGFAGPDRVRLGNNATDFQTSRAELVSSAAAAQVRTTWEFLTEFFHGDGILKPNRALGPSSELRHLAGRWGAAAGLSHIVENGTFIVGVMYSGMRWEIADKRSGFPADIYVAAKRTPLKRVERWIAASEVHGQIRSYNMIENDKVAAGIRGAKSGDPAVWLESVEAICRISFEKSIRMAISERRWQRHPTYERYAAAYAMRFGDGPHPCRSAFEAKYGCMASKHLTPEKVIWR